MYSNRCLTVVWRPESDITISNLAQLENAKRSLHGTHASRRPAAFTKQLGSHSPLNPEASGDHCSSGALHGDLQPPGGSTRNGIATLVQPEPM